MVYPALESLAAQMGNVPMAEPPSLIPPDPRRVRPGESRQRDHLANMRTLLAWIRLAVGLFAFGFVIGRFGLLLAELGPQAPFHSRLSAGHSLVFGLFFVVSGIVVATLAFSYYRAVERDIESGLVQPYRLYVYWLVVPCVVTGVLLLLYLVISWPS